MKSKEVSILVIASLILLPFLGGESFAQSNQVLTVTTEKESYAAGEPIEVFGPYTIMVNYGENSTQVEFEYGGMMSAGVQTTPEFAMEENENTSQSIMIEDHSLDYELTCAEIQSMTPDTEMKSMIIAIKTDCDGELTITLPKDVIDTDENGFFVLVDGDETNHKASSVGEFWTLTIPFSYGSEEIEIIGTFVIPEFGTIAALVLVVAISSILIISAKNKQIFIPRM